MRELNLLKLYRVLVMGGAVLVGSGSCGSTTDPRVETGGDSGTTASIQDAGNSVADGSSAGTDGGLDADGGACAGRSFADCQPPCVPWGMALCCG